METRVKNLQAKVQKAQYEVEELVEALDQVAKRWKSIQNSFEFHSDCLESLSKFTDLRSKLEFEQMTVCDLLLCEISKSLLIFENEVTQASAELRKIKDTLKSKDLSTPWSFPPTPGFLGTSIVEAEQYIDSSIILLEKYRLGIFNLRSEVCLTPDAISAFSI